ncbi:hypothetical protein M1L60_12540 [Actinoplanes sp. TRM 88003]|uniref:SWIM-type domain-containing protein n=1 Tax=Paractinoplanes aksuensis TaxID=2939490 RepID=A0ABT1DKU7_9ACTN|nr:hypothetical protein [Actinoplanes aksuensis]MCO8271424.1 hypothetical protein [Actinoplanes aksuensis]
MSDDRLAVAFLGTFESLRMGPTFARGRRDERSGHVRSLTISSSLVVAQVRGPEDPRAFRARIAVRAFGASEWAALEEAMASEARFAASLLGGRMPDGIADVFAAAGLSLVPLSLDEVAMDCSCERWPMPCVHLAATCYAVARSFQEDPFGAFTWRGRGRDELLVHLRELRSAHAVAASSSGSGAAGGHGAGSSVGGYGAGSSAGARTDEPAGSGEDLGEVDHFWGSAGPAAVPVGGRPGAVSRPDALLDQLDPPPLAEAGRPIVEVLRPAYRALPDE